MFRLDAWDLGRPGGGGPVPSIEGLELSDSASVGGTKFDRARGPDLLRGGEDDKFTADAERGGARLELSDVGGFERPGEAVCALEGGGGATADFSG
jgi:hypothetical protein